MPFNLTRRYREHRAFDPLVHAKTSISHAHRLIHDGMVFHASGQVADVAVAGTFEFIFSVPADVFLHLQKVTFFLEGTPCQVQVYEGTTTSADGTEITPLNTNRNSARTAAASLFHTPTITGDGTLIHDRYFPSPTKDAGLIGGALHEEWILKPSTKYLFRLTNNTGALLDFGFEGSWYEPSYDDLP